MSLFGCIRLGLRSRRPFPFAPCCVVVTGGRYVFLDLVVGVTLLFALVEHLRVVRPGQHLFAAIPEEDDPSASSKWPSVVEVELVFVAALALEAVTVARTTEFSLSYC